MKIIQRKFLKDKLSILMLKRRLSFILLQKWVSVTYSSLSNIPEWKIELGFNFKIWLLIIYAPKLRIYLWHSSIHNQSMISTLQAKGISRCTKDVHLKYKHALMLHCSWKFTHTHTPLKSRYAKLWLLQKP